MRKFTPQIKSFLLGMGMVGLVSANAIIVNHSFYLFAFILGCLISTIWVSGVNHLVKAQLSVKLCYILGAGTGSVLGIIIAKLLATLV